ISIQPEPLSQVMSLESKDAARLTRPLGGLPASRNSKEIMNNTQTLIATLVGAPDIIISLVRELPSQNLKRRPSLNKWSAHEHACHISTVDTAYLLRL